MTPKNKLITVIKATVDGGLKNQLYINNNDIKCFDWEVKIYGADRKKVEHFHELNEDSEVNSAEIILKFGSENKYAESKEGEIQYLFSNPNPKSEEELKELETKALTDYLKNKGASLLGGTGKEKNDMVITMLDNGGRINLSVGLKGSNGALKEVRGKEIKIKAQWFVREKLTLGETIKIEPEKKNPYLTRNKIIFFSTVVIILSGIIIIYRKEIWGWIKPETKDEKKVREQLDIF